MNLLTFIISAVFGIGFSFILNAKNKVTSIKEAQDKSSEMIATSQTEAKSIIEEAKLNVQKSKDTIEHFSERKKEYVQKLQNTVEKKEQLLDKKQNRLSETVSKVEQVKNSFHELKDQSHNFDEKIIGKLSHKLSQNTSEVKNSIIEDLAGKITQAHKDRLGRYEEHVKENAEKIARRELVDVIQRLCAPTSVERRAAVVKVKKDIVKQKIFGENGDNIRIVEDYFGVDIVFNDAPQTKVCQLLV